MATPDHVRRRGRWALVLGTLAATAILVAAASADNVVNTLDTTIDATKESMNLTAGGGSGSTRIWVQNVNINGGDTNNPCNVAGAASLTVNVQSSNSAVATVAPSTITIDDCSTGNTADPGELAKMRLVTVTPVSAGSADITFSQNAFNGSGTFNYAPAAFTVNVAPPPDSTAPVITPNVSGTLGSNGWYTSDVAVSWTVVDNESSITSSSGCGSTTIASDTSGVTLTCTATSAGGTASQSVTIKRDATAPTVSGSASPAPNANGWNNEEVTVSFTCSDLTSGIASCTSPQTLTGEGAGQSASGTATDNAGNTSSTTVGGINIDKTAPSASASASPAANGNGWNNTDVTVSFSGGDGLSGIDFCADPVVLSSEGSGQSASGTCTDKAGNVSDTATASGINIDKTAPSVALVGGPANGASYYFGFVPAAPTCTASDALSGLDGSCGVSGYGTTVGSHTVTATAKDKAGNSDSASNTYTVLAWSLTGFFQPVDMGGVFNTVKNGSTVPLKFRIFAGTTELTDTASVKSLTSALINCDASAPQDEVETTATGGTVLRYDTTSGQFIYNWKTPGTAGKCYRVTMLAQDGSSLVAFFRLK